MNSLDPEFWSTHSIDANEPNRATEQKHIQNIIEAINDGKMTVITVLEEFRAEPAAGNRLLFDDLSENQRWKLQSIIKPFFAYYGTPNGTSAASFAHDENENEVI